jgi:hypothetical protein
VVWTACGSVALECETEIGNERTNGSETRTGIESEKMIEHANGCESSFSRKTSKIHLRLAILRHNLIHF